MEINIPMIPLEIKSGDYTAADGRLFCGVCNKAKQVYLPSINGTPRRIVTALCGCQTKKRDAEIAEMKQHEMKERIESLKSAGLTDPKFRCSTFESAKNTPILERMKMYCEKWQQMYSSNTGMIFYGNPGCGKTFAAACIANELMSRGIPVLMINLSRLLNEITAHFDDRNDYIRSVCDYPLLILDDFGAERNTDFSLEQIYSVIDGRYRKNKPLIITTNLSQSDVQDCTEIGRQRIYSRVLEMCPIPFTFPAKAWRSDSMAQKRENAIKILTEETK